MAFKLLLSLLFTTTAFAQLRTQDFQQSLNAKAPRNYIKNSGAEKNLLNVSNSIGSFTRTTTAPLEGSASFAIDSANSAEYVAFEAEPIQAGLVGKTCEATFTYSGDASQYKALVQETLGGTQISALVALENVGSNAQPVSILFPCGSSTSNAHYLRIDSYANGAAIKVDSVYMGEAVSLGNIAQASYVGGVNFGPGSSLLWSRSSATMGDLTKAGSDGTNINSGQCVVDTTTAGATCTNLLPGRYQVLFTGTVFKGTATTAPCRYTISDGTSPSGETAVGDQGAASTQYDTPQVAGDFSYATTQSSVTFRLQSAQVNAGQCVIESRSSVVSGGPSIKVYRFPLASQLVVRQDAPGAYLTAYTPVLTGATNAVAMTNQTTAGFYKCENQTLTGNITTVFSGAPGGGTGPFRWSLPANFTADTSKIAQYSATSAPVGTISMLDFGTAYYRGITKLADSTGLFGQATDTGNEINSTTPVTVASGDRIGLNFSVPVTADSPCSKGAQVYIPGSFYSKAPTIQRTESVTFGGTPVNGASCGSSPCTVWYPTGAISSVTRASTGRYTVTFANAWPTLPTCTCNSVEYGVNYRSCGIDRGSSTTSAMVVFTYDSTTTGAKDTFVDMQCTGNSY